MAAALAERQKADYPELFAAHPISGSRTERIDGIVAHRAALFETVTPLRRSALAMMHRTPAIRTQQTKLTAHLRRQLTSTFEPELSAVDSGAAAEMLEVLDRHTSWDTWERLRRWQRLSVERSCGLMTSLVAQALEH